MTGAGVTRVGVARVGIALALTVALIGALLFVLRSAPVQKTFLTAYFDNSTGIYPGDDVRILGVPVGKIESIEPQPQRAKITFWVDGKYKVPADAEAVILSPTIVTARFIQLTPVYTTGPALPDGAVIPQERTAVPVEWDDLREQLRKLNATLAPTRPGGVSTLGAFVTTVANNLRGQGPAIRESMIALSQSLSILADRSGDLFGTLENLSILVSALQNSTGLMRQLNGNLAAVTALLADDPGEIGTAVTDLNTAVTDLRGFLAENHDSLGTTFDKLAEVTAALGESSGDLKQTLHLSPNALANVVNIYQPAHSSINGSLAGVNFANPISFICGAVQAASRMNAEQSAKLCVQYLAPIMKNRQYNFLGPLGFSGTPIPPFFPVGARARPNEVTFSEDWMRPDFVPPAPSASPADTAPVAAGPLAAEAPAPPPSAAPATPTDPGAGLPGMMLPPGVGS
ncbi:MCE family protein [Mycolicibacterium sp.]|uniref:MCE family protein n=1 Tax=Mycolicibacterium sp. TaxID=2320850 RepID=UPI003D0AE3F8